MASPALLNILQKKLESRVEVANETSVNRTLTELSSSSLLFFRNCNDSSYILPARCLKIIIERCNHCNFILQGEVSTGTLEMINSEGVVLDVQTLVATISIDGSHNFRLSFAEKRFMQWVVTTNSSTEFELKIQDEVHVVNTGPETEEGGEILQYVTFFERSSGQLKTEKAVREGGGYLTPSSLNEAAQQRLESNLRILMNR
eukprot:TRINITY_DN8653_c0_g1_i1.p1 TRINITY_DN8653_c0_g1~~TRINITY_DN8653_c0_g1_i1.p1  ORF type:complete len:213 (+),score=43.56 TRINITY_DN8653_c0_g1_i1:34-639(+)